MLVWQKSPMGLRCDQWDDTSDECEDACGLVSVGGEESAQKISLFGGGGGGGGGGAGLRGGGVRRGGWSGGGGRLNMSWIVSGFFQGEGSS